ncbi:MAG: TOBE domain-containing protein [Campylobacteraceae bacterium]|nr:TOBE domain-containing protein [Campylobacteraceae bacterium]
MNKISTSIVSIQNEDILNIVEFAFSNLKMSMMSLELEELKAGDKVLLSFKSSCVGIGKDFSGKISYSNCLKGKIVSLDNGFLLSNVRVLVQDVLITSVITAKSSARMELKVGDEVTCIIKASDLFILEKIS